MTTPSTFYAVTTSTFAVPEPSPLRTPQELEVIAIDVARRAALIVRAGYGGARAVRTKSSATDVVTQVDLDSEAEVRRLLLEATPEAGLLGEEGGGTDPTRSLQWIIDPLDGTVNFLYGIPVFAVSIAASVNGTIVAGAVVDVLRGEMFSAHVDGGARCDGSLLTAPQCDDLSQALIATGYSYQAELRSRQGAIVQQLLSHARDVRCFGSAALELCWVACGRFNGYFERDTKLWDFAAGSLIAAEAGAGIELPCPENADLVLASAPGIFDALQRVVHSR